jgi:tRNA pseudouridine38-40 synthase
MKDNNVRYFMKLAYDGTNYCGWQRQPAHPSVQQTIEEKLSMILNKTTTVMGCGRTDTGVHAKDFILHFETDSAFTKTQLVHQLNATLPADIAIKDIYPVPEDFHARFSATSRSYEYHFHFKKSPFKIKSSWLLKTALNNELIQQACPDLLGQQDFTSFAKVHSDVNNHICTITEARWEFHEDGAIFHISANRFLRNMVRAIVGTLIQIGEEKIKPEALKEIIAKKNRAAAGKSVPAHGLYLTNITYPSI